MATVQPNMTATHIKERIEAMTKHPGGTGQPSGSAIGSKEREFERTPWYWPPRWFGYKWRRAEYALWQIGGGVDRWEYWTDKQMAHRAFRLAAGYNDGPRHFGQTAEEGRN